MLINISGRTDIINYYSEWMFKRFEAGWVLSRNSLFPNSVRRYELTPGKVWKLRKEIGGGEYGAACR